MSERISGYNKHLIYLAFLMTLISLPIDALPGLFPSVYRPLSLVFVMVGNVFMLVDFLVFKDKYVRGLFKSVNLLLIIFYIITMFSSYFMTRIQSLPMDGFLDYSTTLTLGIGTYFLFDYNLKDIRRKCFSVDDYLLSIFTIIGFVYVVPLLFGVVELAVIFSWIPLEVKTAFVRYVSDVSHSRIQLFSGEPSWASMHLIYILPINLFLAKKSVFFRWMFFIALILFIFSFSLQGYLTFFIGFFIFILYRIRDFKFYRVIYVFSVIVVLSYAIWLVASYFFADVYFITRFENIDFSRGINGILYLDGSVFVRFVYPFLGLMMFKDYFLFGVGGGNFRYYFKYYLIKHFPSGLGFDEVFHNYARISANSKNLLTRLMGENGLISTAVFCSFVLFVIKKVGKQNIEQKYLFEFWIILGLANMVQFDSFAYVHLWLLLAIVNNVKMAEYSSKFAGFWLR